MGSSLKQRQNVLQGSNTNLELNTLPLAKWVSLVTIRNIPFSRKTFSICTADCKL